NSYGDSKQPVGPAASRMMSAGAAGSGLPASRGDAVVGGGGQGQGQVALNRPMVIHVSHSDTSPPLRSIVPVAPGKASAREDRNEEAIRRIKSHVPQYLRVDTVVQSTFGPLVMPAPLLTFEGYGQQDN